MDLLYILVFLLTVVFYYRKQFYSVLHKFVTMQKVPSLLKYLRKYSSKNMDSDQNWKALIKSCTEFVKTTKNKLASLNLGPLSVLFLLHPDTAKVFLRGNKSSQKSLMYKLFVPWLKDGIALSYEDKWKHRRNLVTPPFHSIMLKSYLNAVNTKADLLIVKLSEIVKEEKKVDISKFLKLCAFDIICETALGINAGALENKKHQYIDTIHELAKVIEQRRLNPILFNDFIFSFTHWSKKQKELLKIVHGFTGSIITEAKKNLIPESSESKSLLETLLVSNNADGTPLTFEDIQEEIDGFIFGGLDTSSTVLLWTIYLLGKYPEVQKKLQEEVDDVLPSVSDQFISYEHLKDLQYMNLVLKEAMRLYPPVPVLGRTTETDYVVDNKLIPKGVDVLILVHFIHRNPDVWPDPNKFDPQRFSIDQASERSPFAYIPFSAGSRNCIGQRFAWQEMKIILAKFVQNFQIKSSGKDEDIKVSLGLTYEPACILDINLSLRKNV